MHPQLIAILADGDEPSFVGPDTIAPEAELTASPVSRVAARAGLPRAHVWTQFPDTVTGRAMRASSTLTVAVTTSPIFQNAYLPPDHRFTETPWVFPGANPISEAEAEALGEKLGREILHTMFASGQHVGAGAEDDEDEGLERAVDGLIFPFGIGNISLRAGAAFLDLNPIYGHPDDAIQTGIYSETGQYKETDIQPTTETAALKRGRFTVFTANSRAIGRAIWRGCWQYVKANRLAYVPPGGGGPYELCIPDGFCLDVEEFLDRRLFHQDQWDGARYVRKSDLREMFLARREDGTATTRASTEPIMYGPGGVPWTLDDWWENDVVARGVWPDTKVLPEGRNFYEVGSPVENLGKEIGILSHAIVEFYLGETIIAEYIEAFGRAPRWTNFQGGFCKQGSDAPATAFFDGMTRYPAVTMNYLRGWLDDTATYGSSEAITTADRVAEIERVHAYYDLTRPSIAEVPVPRDGGKATASIGDEDDTVALLNAHGEAGIFEFVIWNDETDQGNNRDVELFLPAWERHLAWAAHGAEEPGSGNVTAIIPGYFEDDLPAVSYAILDPDVDDPPLTLVCVDAGIAAYLFLKILKDGLAEITGDEGRGDVVHIEHFGDNPRPDRLRRARIMNHQLRPIPRPAVLGCQDARIYEVAIGCFVDQGKAKSAHAAAEVASLIRRALDNKGAQHAPTTHILNVISIEDGMATPSDPKADAVAMVGVTCMVTRDVGASIKVQGGAA